MPVRHLCNSHCAATPRMFAASDLFRNSGAAPYFLRSAARKRDSPVPRNLAALGSLKATGCGVKAAFINIANKLPLQAPDTPQPVHCERDTAQDRPSAAPSHLAPVVVNNDFDFELALQSGFDDEVYDATDDVGPIGDWESEETQRQYDLFYGPMDSPLSSPANSPSPSRNPSPSRTGASSPPPPKQRPPQPAGFNPPTKRGRSGSPSTPPRVPLPPARAEIRGGNSKQRRDKNKSRKSRQKRRALAREAAEEGRMAGGADTSRHAPDAEKLDSKFDSSKIPSSSSGYTAKPDAKGRVYALDEVLGMGLKLIQWDGRTPRPILDKDGRVVAVLAGSPRDTGWEDVHQTAFKLLRNCAKRCRFSNKAMNHRRGLFAVLNVGISFGGGQTAPGSLCHPPFRAQEITALLSSPAFTRIAGFASGAFSAWMPRLHAYYTRSFTSLLSHPSPRPLHRNFQRSVWAAAAFNCGPRTISTKHRDFANLPFGICSVTALGNYDHTAGGHLVLWELGLVVEFPPGSTVLLPSAAVAHSNTPIAKHELRGSFAQYSAGGLFRWVDHGFQNDAPFFKGLTKAEKEEIRVENVARGKLGLSLFSTYDELCKRPATNKRTASQNS